MNPLSVTNSVDVATAHHAVSKGLHNGEPLPRMLVSVTEASRALGVSRSFAYELVAAEVLKSIRLGRRVLVPVSALENLIAASGVER